MLIVPLNTFASLSVNPTNGLKYPFVIVGLQPEGLTRQCRLPLFAVVIPNLIGNPEPPHPFGKLTSWRLSGTRASSLRKGEAPSPPLEKGFTLRVLPEGEIGGFWSFRGNPVGMKIDKLRTGR